MPELSANVRHLRATTSKNVQPVHAINGMSSGRKMTTRSGGSLQTNRRVNSK
jgi:hypothetical protein